MKRTTASLLILMLTSCAGARISITAERSRYPLSLSPVIRDNGGRLYGSHSLIRLGVLSISRTPFGLFYSSLAFHQTCDLSDEVNAQVEAVGGEAVVDVTVLVRPACGVLNGFPFLNALPFWPGCVPVTLTGDIVRRAYRLP